MKICPPTAIQKIIMAGLVILALMLIYGCAEESYDCPIEDRYIAGYEPVTYPSGDVYYETIWECP